MSEWKPIETAPRDGTPVKCLWPGYGQPAGKLHEGVCIYKRDWYVLGKAVELETWWTGPEFKNPTAKEPTHWMPLPAAPTQETAGSMGHDPEMAWDPDITESERRLHDALQRVFETHEVAHPIPEAKND